MPATAAKVVSGRVSVYSIRAALAFLTAPSAASLRAKIHSPECMGRGVLMGQPRNLFVSAVP